jgi:predicted permease
VLIAGLAVRLLSAILPADLPRQQGIAMNLPVLLFALTVTVAVALSLGLFTAWRAGGADVRDALNAGAHHHSRSSAVQRLRSILVAGEIAMTLVVLVSAGLLGRSFMRLISTSPGFRLDHLITVQFSLPPGISALHNSTGEIDPTAIARQAHKMDDLLTRLRALPAAENVGLVGALPVAAGDNLADGDFLVLNGIKPPANFDEWDAVAHNPLHVGHALYCVASRGYFITLGIPLIRGRLFGEQDNLNSPNAAVISETLARQRWPNQDAIGQIIDFGNMDGDLRPLTIVGIVGDVRAQGLDLPPAGVIYVDYRERGMNSNSTPTILMRITAPEDEIVPAARAIFHNIAPDAPVKFSTFAVEMGGWLAERRFLLLLVGLFAAAALLLATVGIYGVVAFFVARRTQEIGIRMAVGAQRSDVLRLVLGEGARMAAFGVSIGIVASLAINRLLSSLLFGISAADPLTLVGMAMLLSLVALVASYIPALRAMRVDPVIALRFE